METGINLFCYDGLDINRQIELMQENDFAHTFIMADNPLLDGSLIDKVKRAGITFDTLHAPFYGINDIWKPGIDGGEMLRRLIECVHKCADFDIPVAVVHLSSGKPAPIISDVGNNRFARLIEKAREKNITLAFENQRFVANLASVIEQHNDVGFCWDVGHEGCFTKGIHFMNLFGSRLTAVHLHDNHPLPYEDEHLIPFDGVCDYEFIAETLAHYNFSGTVMLELFRSESDKYKSTTAEEYYSRAGAAAKKIVRLIESKKQ